MRPHPGRSAVGALGRGAVVASVALGLGLAGTPASAAEAQDSAVQDFGSCLASDGGGDLLLLVDESGSLRDSDPQDARLAAARYLVEQMAATSASAGLSLDVAVAGFAADFEVVQDWTRLDAPGTAATGAAIASFADRDNGLDTDYWNALEGARRELADHVASTGSATRCQAIAWFSDGQLDIEARDTAARRRSSGGSKVYAPGVDLRSEEGAAAAEAAATDSLCRAGGLADQLRASGVWTFGVGLAAGTAQAQDFSLMQSIATGSAPGGPGCGQIQQPMPGVFALASDIDDLLFAFDAFANPQQAPVQQLAGVCQASVCSEEAHRFVLDASISSVHVLGSSDVSGVRVVLVAPDGTQLPLDRGAIGTPAVAEAGGATITSTWHSDRTIAVDLVDPGGAAGWSGAWSLVFVDDSATSPDGESRSNIHISGDLRPTWTTPGDAPLHVGEAAPGFRIGLADAAGVPVDPASLLGTVLASAVLVGADGTTTVIADGLAAADLGTDLTLDLTSAAPGDAVVRLQLVVTTAPATLPDGTVEPGTTLTPQRVDVPVTLLPPVDFPTVGPRLDFGVAEGAADLTAGLAVTGPGCVWIEPGAADVVAFPAEVGDIVVATPEATAADACTELAEGETASLPVTLTTAAAGNGSINGTVGVRIAPVGEPDRATVVAVTFSADLRKPLDRATFWLGLVAALVLGPGLPIGLLYVLKAAGARIPPRALAARTVPVTVREGLVLRDGAPFALRDTDLVDLVRLSARGARRLELDGLTLRTRVGWSPFGPGYVVVESPGLVGVSSQFPAPSGRHGQARLRLAVHNAWVLLVDPDAPGDEARVLLLVGADASAQLRQDLVDDLNRRGPDLVRDLRASARPGGPAGGPTDGPGPASVVDPFGAAAVDAGPPATTVGLGVSDDPFNFSVGDTGQR